MCWHAVVSYNLVCPPIPSHNTAVNADTEAAVAHVRYQSYSRTITPPLLHACFVHRHVPRLLALEHSTHMNATQNSMSAPIQHISTCRFLFVFLALLCLARIRNLTFPRSCRQTGFVILRSLHASHPLASRITCNRSCSASTP